MASLRSYALVLLHLLRWFHWSYFRQYLKLAQLHIYSEGFLLSTMCTWTGLLTSPSAKKAALLRAAPIPLWTDFRDVLVIVALLYCTCALHKIFSKEMTKEEVASLKKKKINFHFAVMGLPSFPLNAIPQMFTRVSLTRLDYYSGTNCFI